MNIEIIPLRLIDTAGDDDQVEAIGVTKGRREYADKADIILLLSMLLKLSEEERISSMM